MTDIEGVLRVACLQFCPGEDLEANAATALSIAHQAVREGARLLLLPEYATVLHGSGRVMRETARAEDAHPMVAQLRAFAAESGAWILIGSVTVPVEEGRIANRSLLLSDA